MAARARARTHTVFSQINGLFFSFSSLSKWWVFWRFFFNWLAWTQRSYSNPRQSALPVSRLKTTNIMYSVQNKVKSPDLKNGYVYRESWNHLNKNHHWNTFLTSFRLHLCNEFTFSPGIRILSVRSGTNIYKCSHGCRRDSFSLSFSSTLTIRIKSFILLENLNSILFWNHLFLRHAYY